MSHPRGMQRDKPAMGLMDDLISYTFHSVNIGQPGKKRIIAMSVPFNIDGIAATEIAPNCWSMEAPVGFPVVDVSIKLTQRERDLCEALDNNPLLGYKLIAYGLGVEMPTLKTHLWHLFKKFNVHSKKQLIEAYKKWR